MTSTAFQILTMEEKIDHLSDAGVFLMSRDTLFHNVFLYGYEGIYVEVFYLKLTTAVDKIEVLRDEKILNIYLGKINLSF